jgi:Tfp pilus assembly protein PilO
LHDVEIKPVAQGGYDQLQLDVTARTYRYLDEEELASAEAERQKTQQAQRGSSGG